MNGRYVSAKACELRHASVDDKLNEIITILKGSSKNPGDLGLMGEIRDIKRDRKWIYGLITIIAIPSFSYIIKILVGG